MPRFCALLSCASALSCSQGLRTELLQLLAARLLDARYGLVVTTETRLCWCAPEIVR